MLDEAAKEVVGWPLGLDGRDLSDVLDPRAIVRTRMSAGGSAPEVVRGMAGAIRAAAEGARSEAARRAESYAGAERALLSLAREAARG